MKNNLFLKNMLKENKKQKKSILEYETDLGNLAWDESSAIDISEAFNLYPELVSISRNKGYRHLTSNYMAFFKAHVKSHLDLLPEYKNREIKRLQGEINDMQTSLTNISISPQNSFLRIGNKDYQFLILREIKIGNSPLANGFSFKETKLYASQNFNLASLNAQIYFNKYYYSGEIKQDPRIKFLDIRTPNERNLYDYSNHHPNFLIENDNEIQECTVDLILHHFYLRNLTRSKNFQELIFPYINKGQQEIFNQEEKTIPVDIPTDLIKQYGIFVNQTAIKYNMDEQHFGNTWIGQPEERMPQINISARLILTPVPFFNNVVPKENYLYDLSELKESEEEELNE